MGKISYIQFFPRLCHWKTYLWKDANLFQQNRPQMGVMTSSWSKCCGRHLNTILTRMHLWKFTQSRGCDSLKQIEKHLNKSYFNDGDQIEMEKEFPQKIQLQNSLHLLRYFILLFHFIWKRNAVFNHTTLQIKIF